MTQPSKPQAADRARGTKHSRRFLDELREFAIHLPSSYPECVREHPAMKEAVTLELAMRKADADDALDQVRAHLAATYGLHRHLQKATTQPQKLCSSAPAQCLHAAVTALANVYRRPCCEVAQRALHVRPAERPIF